MVPLLSEAWRLAEYLLRPEDHSEGARFQPPPFTGRAASALAGALKTLFWACLALLAGLGLGRLGG